MFVKSLRKKNVSLFTARHLLINGKRTVRLIRLLFSVHKNTGRLLGTSINRIKKELKQFQLKVELHFFCVACIIEK